MSSPLRTGGKFEMLYREQLAACRLKLAAAA
jgi:hypothetical protein